MNEFLGFIFMGLLILFAIASTYAVKCYDKQKKQMTFEADPKEK
jgi:hypothetical protein